MKRSRERLSESTGWNPIISSLLETRPERRLITANTLQGINARRIADALIGDSGQLIFRSGIKVRRINRRKVVETKGREPEKK